MFYSSYNVFIWYKLDSQNETILAPQTRGPDCIYLDLFATNTGRSRNAGSMLGHRLRRWPNIEPTLPESLVFAGK